MTQRKHTWSLSQDANKKSGTCSVCLDVFRLHHKDGTIHQHGPRDSRCPGSHKPPLGAQIPPSQPSVSNPVGSASIHSSIPAATAQAPGPSITATNIGHPNLTRGTIKHIPKSARSTCAAYLISSLVKIQRDPDDFGAWS